MTPLAELIKKSLMDTGDSEKDALLIAERIITWGVDNGVSGECHYWPHKFRPLTQKERSEGIKLEFKGNNLKSICEKYRVTPQTVYRLTRN